MGHHWGFRRETGEPQITVNYARAFSDFLVNFTFSRGVSFLSPDETSAIIPTRLKRIWEDDNPKMSLLWEIGNMGSVSGDVFVKVAYEEPWVDPGGLPHPGRVRILPLNPSFCFPEFHPHDRKRIIRFKLKYRFWGTTLEGTRQVFTYCMDDATEILTQQGWKHRCDLTTDDKALSLDPKSDEIRWEPVLAVNSFDWDGPLTRWKNRGVDALSTPNHRWIVQDWRARDPRYTSQGHVFKETRQLSHGRGSDHIIAGGGTPLAFSSTPKWSDDFVELIGWVITEGHYRHYTGNESTIVLTQSQSANPEYVSRIRRLRSVFQAEGANFREWPDKARPEMIRWFISEDFARTVREVSPDRQLTPEFLCSLTYHQAQMLYETLHDGDGHRHSASGLLTEIWSQKDQGRIDGFQMLCAMLGRRTHNRKSEYHSGSDVTVFRSRNLIANTIKSSEEYYQGKVWCPSVATKTWLCRRNGVTYWTGNTELLTDESIEEFVNDELIDARPNPLGTIPIVNIANLPVSSSPWGLSDTQDILGLNREFNEKMTEVSTIVNYHSAPVTVLIGGKSSNLEKGAKKVWSIPNEKAKIQNLENDPEGAKFAMEYIDRLKTMMHELVGIPVGALGQSQPISNTSGVALAIQFLTTMMRYHLKCTVYGEGLVRINEIALRLLFLKEPWATLHDPENDPPLEDGQLDHLDPNDLISYRSETQFPPPLPVDRLVKLNEIQVLLALGLESKKGALRDLGEEFVSEKMQELFDELLGDAEHQAALDLMKAQVAAVIAQLTGMYPTESGPEPVPPPPASASGENVQSAGGPNVNSAGSPGPSGPLPGAVAASILSPEDQQGLMQRIVALAAGTQLPQRRSPEPKED